MFERKVSGIWLQPRTRTKAADRTQASRSLEGAHSGRDAKKTSASGFNRCDDLFARMARILRRPLNALRAGPTDRSPRVPWRLAGEQTLHHRLSIKADRSGHEVYTFCSLDQDPKAIPCTNAKLNSENLSFAIPIVQGYCSVIVADSKTLSGSGKQSTARPLNFDRREWHQNDSIRDC
jgi:hypothetical protein